MQVLLTRPQEQSRVLAETLKAAGIEPMIWPLTRMVTTATTLHIPAHTEALLFTSANAVRAFAELAERRDLPALCVGAATAAGAREAGFGGVISANGDARDLAELARKTSHREFFHPRGRDTASDLKGWLAETGHKVTEAVLYQAEEAGPPPATIAAALAGGDIGLVTIWSRRGGEILARRLAEIDTVLSNTALLAISPRAASPLEQSGFGWIIIAKAPARSAMLAEIQAYSSDPLK